MEDISFQYRGALGPEFLGIAFGMSMKRLIVR